MRSQESGSRNSEGPDNPSRRRFLKGALSAAAIAASPRVAKAITSQELMRNSGDERYFNTLINDRAARKRFQESATRKEAASVLRTISKVNADWIVELGRDKEGMHKGALAFNDRGRVMGNGTIVKIPRDVEKGFDYVVVTASHVADFVPPPTGTYWTRHPEERDVAVRSLTKGELSRAITESNALLLPSLEDGKEDITGVEGAVVAYGNGKDTVVRKFYPSRLSPKVSFTVMKAAHIGIPKPAKYQNKDDYDANRMMILPHGEATVLPNEKHPPMDKVSGSAFVYRPKNANEMAMGGIFVSGVRGAYAEGTTYEVGFVLDHMYVREAIAEHLKGVVR